MVKQLTVFLENRGPRLEKLTEILRTNKINIVSLCLGDSAEYGMLRMIVSEPDRAKEILKEAGYAVMVTNVLAVLLPNKPGALNEMLKIIASAKIEYIYGLVSRMDSTITIVKMADVYSTMALLENAGYSMMEDTTVYQLGNL